MTHPTAARLASDLREGRLDPLDLVAETLDRIAACDDQAIFIETLAPRAQAEARASRERLRAGFPASALDGVPVGWKDLFDLRGRVTTAGSVVLKDEAPAAEDAALVRTGARAGLVSVGTVNMTEFAYSGIGLNPHYGTPRNPHGTGAARVPGGSSSGSGVAVARGLVPISVGTDTGGSVRIPASFNGVVGYKATTGRYPMEGAFPLSWSLDSLGPLAQTVEDCALADAVLRNGAPDLRAADLSALRLVVPDAVVFDAAEPEVLANFEAALDRLARAGARVSRLPIPQLRAIGDLATRYGMLAGAEALALHRDRIAGPDAGRMDARVVRRIRQAEGMTAADLVMVLRERSRLMAEVEALVGDALIACPTTPKVAMEAAPLEADQELFFRMNGLTLRNTALGNFLDWCGLSIPNGTGEGGMPTGFLLSATRGRDALLLAAGLAAEPIIRG